MYKYLIEVSGSGSECFVFDIKDEQREILLKSKDDINDLTVDEILEILDEDSLYDSGHFYVGPFNTQGSLILTVKDEDGKKIWRSPNNFQLSVPQENIEFMCNSKNTLIISTKSNGIFYDYEIEVEDKFEEEKISAIVTEIGGTITLVSDITYEGVSLNTYKEYGDYNSKEYSYTLI